MIRVIYFLLGLALFGCDSTPTVETKATNNPSVPVSLLFEHDGCRVYRFEADGRYRYFARCPGSVDTIGTHTEYCGKNCTKTIDDEIRTETR